MPTLRITDRKGQLLEIPVNVEQPRQTLLTELAKRGQEMIGQCGGHGICSRCQVTVHSGGVHDVQEPMSELGEGKKLACCSVHDLSQGDLDVTLDYATFMSPRPASKP